MIDPANDPEREWDCRRPPGTLARCLTGGAIERELNDRFLVPIPHTVYGDSVLKVGT
jgi:hypothetical protein